MNTTKRLGVQLVVLVPTLVTSLLLAHEGVPPMPRLLLSLGVGMTLIGGVALWRRGKN